MDLLNLDKAGPDTARAAVDEAALKLDPMLKLAIDHLLVGLKDVLVGRTVTITVK